MKLPPPDMSASELPVGACRVEASDYQPVFDALPVPTFIVNRDCSILDLNDAASRMPEDILMATIRPSLNDHTIGQLYCCVHAAGGCGKSQACRQCGVLTSIEQAAQGRTVRTAASLVTWRAGSVTHIDLRVAARQVPDTGNVVLMLDDQADWKTVAPASQPSLARGAAASGTEQGS